MNAPTYGMGNTAIFEDLQKKIDEDVQVRDQLREILQVLDRQGESQRPDDGVIVRICRQDSSGRAS